jgi:hypothetical protein
MKVKVELNRRSLAKLAIILDRDSMLGAMSQREFTTAVAKYLGTRKGKTLRNLSLKHQETFDLLKNFK